MFIYFDPLWLSTQLRMAVAVVSILMNDILSENALMLLNDDYFMQ